MINLSENVKIVRDGKEVNEPPKRTDNIKVKVLLRGGLPSKAEIPIETLLEIKEILETVE